jgi:hypothetical protein
MEFLSRLDALLAERGQYGLRAESISRLSEGWELIVSSDNALAHQRLTLAFKDEEIAGLLQSWNGEDLILSVRGSGNTPSKPSALVREGKLFLVSDASAFDPGPENLSFAEWFQALIGAPPPIELELIQIGESLWGSANARGCKVEGFPHVLRIRALKDYSLVGYAGYGCNSYALYVTRVSGDTRMFLRLPWGGAYMNADEDRPRLLEDLRAANGFFETASRKRLPMWLNNNMGAWRFDTAPRPTERCLERVDLEKVREYVDGSGEFLSGKSQHEGKSIR